MCVPQVRGYSLSQQVSVDGETWVTEEYSAPVVHQVVPPPSTNGTISHQSDSKPRKVAEKPPDDQPHSSNPWTPVLILVPVRLGSGDKVSVFFLKLLNFSFEIIDKTLL